MDSTAPSEHLELVRSLHERVGRNIIRVQVLEQSLKNLLPFVSHSEPHCLSGLAERQKKYIRKTLGELAGAFVDTNQTPNDEFTAHVAKMVRDRNNLVHHFHQTYGALAVESADGCKRVIALLDAQFHDIKELERISTEILLEVLQALRDITFAALTRPRSSLSYVLPSSSTWRGANNSFKPKPLRGSA